jgi:hypothetical protein
VIKRRFASGVLALPDTFYPARAATGDGGGGVLKGGSAGIRGGGLAEMAVGFAREEHRPESQWRRGGLPVANEREGHAGVLDQNPYFAPSPQ